MARHFIVWIVIPLLAASGAMLAADPAPLVPIPAGWSAFNAANAPSARFRHTATDMSSFGVLIFGGTADGVNGLSTGAVYNPSTDSWTPTPAAGAPNARFNHTGVFAFNFQHVAVFGGEGSPPTNTGGLYFPSTNTWFPMNTVGGPSARTRHAASLLSLDPIGPPFVDTMFVHGGVDASGNSLGDAFIYLFASDAWSAAAASPLAARHDHTVTNTISNPTGNGEVFVFGGAQMAGFVETTAFNNGAEYDESGNTWDPVVAFGVARARHTAVLKPSPAPGEVGIFGGDNLGVPNNSGIRFNHPSDVFTSMSAVGAPTARTNHSAIFNSGPSAQMIVWGGEGSPPTNTGAHYFFADDCWLPTETVGAPTARSLHTASSINAFPDQGMLIFGGRDAAGGALGDGGRLNVNPPKPGVQIARPIGVNTSGGTLLAINGFNLLGIKAVRFSNGSAAYSPGSGTAAPGFSINNNAEIVAVVPGLAFTGPVHVEVEQCGGQRDEIRRAITSSNSIASVSDTIVGGVTPAAYRMKSVPLFATHQELFSLLQSCLGPYDPRAWRAFAWDASSQGYVELPGLASNDPNGDASGRGVFLISSGDKSCTLTGLNTEPATNFYVLLEPGFNMVSMPSTGSIAWPSVRVGFKGEGSSGANDVPASSPNGFISEVLFAYDGAGYVSASAMVGGESYWVFNKAGFRVVLFIPDPSPKAGEGVQQLYGPIPEGAPTPPAPPGSVDSSFAGDPGASGGGGGGGGGGDSATQVGAAGSVLAAIAVVALVALKGWVRR